MGSSWAVLISLASGHGNHDRLRPCSEGAAPTPGHYCGSPPGLDANYGEGWGRGCRGVQALEEQPSSPAGAQGMPHKGASFFALLKIDLNGEVAERPCQAGPYTTNPGGQQGGWAGRGRKGRGLSPGFTSQRRRPEKPLASTPLLSSPQEACAHPRLSSGTKGMSRQQEPAWQAGSGHRQTPRRRAGHRCGSGSREGGAWLLGMDTWPWLLPASPAFPVRVGACRCSNGEGAPGAWQGTGESPASGSVQRTVWRSVLAGAAAPRNHLHLHSP